jgi:hypothetical protein
MNMGRCKLGWLKSDKSPNPKSSYFNIRMEKIIMEKISSTKIQFIKLND